MEIDNQLRGCFGPGTAHFASHPLDEDRAFAWLTDLRERGVGWSTVKAQLAEYMANWDPEHAEREIGTAERYLRPWLLD